MVLGMGIVLGVIVVLIIIFDLSSAIRRIDQQIDKLSKK